jgi:hypothetical protein
MMPAMIISMEFESLKTFMVAHKIVYPFTFIHVFTTGSHLFMNWLLVQYLQLEIMGAGIALLSTEVLNMICILRT